jgi:thiaminase
MAPLTEHLQSCYTGVLEEASKHPFLAKAGQGTLTAYALCKWLVQDKYYQFGYLNFIGRMCSNLNLDSYAFPKKNEEFKAGIDILAEVLNHWAQREGELKRCEELWAEVLDLEMRFGRGLSEFSDSSS